MCPTGFPPPNRRVGITTPEGRITLTGARTEVFNYFPGWELFWFTLDSPYHGQGLGARSPFGERLDPARSNISGAI
jgi:phosphonate transport system permease protein